jgi:xanthine dehydrogenase small subunit
MREGIRFMLGGHRRELAGIDPTTTVLDWLRGEGRRPGTKEGCNEGDCGACTVVVVRPEGDALTYRAVNACIQLVGTLDGCQLLTIEDLAAPEGDLHPVQRAMVDLHGSQCGFCTPGFVMSMFALAKSSAGVPDEGAIDTALAGNLCRCTGYAPIVRAMQASIAHAPDRFDAGAPETHAQLAALQDEETLAFEAGGCRFIAPPTIDSLAATLVEHPDATVLAGGTDVGLWITKLMRPLGTIVWLGRVAALRAVETTADGLSIGAGATYTDAAEALAALLPDCGEVLRRLGSVQVRNAGTIGGNVANGSPIGDSPPALIAAGATLHLRRGEAARSMPLEAFFLGYGKQDRAPGEFVERITVPRPAPGSRFRAYKITKRFDQDISAVLGAFMLRMDGDLIAEARLAFGGMAGTPARATNAELALRGQTLGEASIEAARAALEKDFKPLDDFRASAWYRMRVAQNLLTRLHLELTEPGVETRLVGDRALAHA